VGAPFGKFLAGSYADAVANGDVVASRAPVQRVTHRFGIGTLGSMRRRPSVPPWEDWLTVFAALFVVVGLTGVGLATIVGSSLWGRAMWTALFAAWCCFLAVGAFGRSVPAESATDRLVRQFRRQMDRDLKRLR